MLYDDCATKAIFQHCVGFCSFVSTYWFIGKDLLRFNRQDDFKRKEKTARLEMQRFAYRSASMINSFISDQQHDYNDLIISFFLFVARLLPNGPERLPLSTILNPSLSLNVAPILNSMLVDRLPMKSAEQLRKATFLYAVGLF